MQSGNNGQLLRKDDEPVSTSFAWTAVMQSSQTKHMDIELTQNQRTVTTLIHHNVQSEFPVNYAPPQTMQNKLERLSNNKYNYNKLLVIELNARVFSPSVYKKRNPSGFNFAI